MSLASLSSKELSRIQKLIERKEVLAQQIAAINTELEAIEAGEIQPGPMGASAVRSGAPENGRRRRSGRGRGRGYLKASISKELQAAGKEGVKVKDLAAKLGTGYGNITTFFQSTARKIKEIKKVGPAQYAWVAS